MNYRSNRIYRVIVAGCAWIAKEPTDYREKGWIQEQTIRYIMEKFGITRVDIRIVIQVVNYDMMEIRTWNGRRFYVTGLELANHMRPQVWRNR